MAMDFFDRQEQARARSKKIVLLFLLALPCVIAAVYAVSVAIYAATYAFLTFWRSVFAEAHLARGGEMTFFISFWQPTLLVWISGATLLVIACGSLLKIRQLAPGGRVVAKLLGGERLDPKTKKLDEQRLLHVVEEMSIASGTPMPDIYILRREFGLNAFVAGHTVSDMVVTVTEGCVRYLPRDELQGIIAHEYSHILNGDMRLNMRLMGIVHGLFCITLLSYWVMSRTHNERERDIGEAVKTRTGALVVIDLAILVVGFLLAFIGWNGAFFGRVIKSAVSRQREFLADAAAVQFTRYPEGLSKALKRVKQSPDGSVIHAVHAEEASHIFFCNGLDDDRIALTSTHPPLEERIARIEAMMGRSWIPEPRKIEDTAFPQRPAESEDEEAFTVEPMEPPSEPQPAAPIAHAAVLANVGVPTGEHLAYAARLIEALPRSIRDAAREPLPATALIYSLLLNGDERVRGAQLRMLRTEIETDIVRAVGKLAQDAVALNEHARIPLVELAFPALRRLSPADYEKFARTMQHLIAEDQQVELFEFALQKMVRRHLQPNFKPDPKTEAQYHSLKGLASACSAVLSALAHTGQDTPELAPAAFLKGASLLGTSVDEMKLRPLSDCTLNTLEISLDNLSGVAPRWKKLFLEACVHIVAADGQVRPREAELLRAIADALDCPVPPFFGSQSRSLAK